MPKDAELSVAAPVGEGSPAVAMRSVLVTGAGGFAGTHLVSELLDRGIGLCAPSRADLDLTDADEVMQCVGDSPPDCVLHLAAFSSPRLSWEAPDAVLTANVRMTLNVLEAVRLRAPQARVVLVGSGQVYGAAERLPIDEEAPLSPLNPYAVSKAACDLLGGQYAHAYGLDVTRLRPFNHAGPGQPADYVVSTLCRQVAEAEATGQAEAVLRTGDVSGRRDFTDVRDVAAAYVAATEAEPGVYNVCSGRSVPISSLIDLVAAESRIPVRHEEVGSRRRSNEPAELRGSHERLTAATGWEPRIPLEQTVRDTLDWWRHHPSS